jgi:SAM-dependent methyltransferase
MTPATPAQAFDKLAADYDLRFTRSRIGGLMRRAVHRRLEARFRPGHRVLELNCGTGEDAVFLGRRGVEVLATDISPSMVEATRAKVEQAGLSNLVGARCLAIEDLDDLEAPPFDGVLSDFGGLNCVADLRSVANGLANRVRPGAVAMLCIMGPTVPWEWLWYSLRGEPRKGFRRLRTGGVEWRGLTIRYPSVGRVVRDFAPAFRKSRVAAIGAILPPPYTEPLTGRFPRLLDWLDRCERLLETVPLLPRLADHFLIELERL